MFKWIATFVALIVIAMPALAEGFGGLDFDVYVGEVDGQPDQTYFYLEEKRRFIFVGSEVLTPIPLPYLFGSIRLTVTADSVVEQQVWLVPDEINRGGLVLTDDVTLTETAGSGGTKNLVITSDLGQVVTLTPDASEQGFAVSSVVPAQVAVYAYNALGQRVKKTVGTEVTYYLYDPQGRLEAELNGDGEVVREYVYANGQLLVLADEVDQAEEAILYYQHDHLGSPVALIDSQKAVVWQQERSPFGEVISTSSSVEQNVRFPGQYQDGETGYVYNYFRDYDPKVGRYLQSDPRGVLLDYSDPQRKVAAAMGIPQVVLSNGEINQNYGYANQSPIKNVDPFGEYFGGGMFGSSMTGTASGSHKQSSAASAAAKGAENALRDPCFVCHVRYQMVCAPISFGMGKLGQAAGGAIGGAVAGPPGAAAGSTAGGAAASVGGMGLCQIVRETACENLCEDEEDECKE